MTDVTTAPLFLRLGARLRGLDGQGVYPGVRVGIASGLGVDGGLVVLTETGQPDQPPPAEVNVAGRVLVRAPARDWQHHNQCGRER